ncbi:MAG TPA: hypothetical protein VIM57_04185, partial [Luteolibacter sp.]
GYVSPKDHPGQMIEQTPEAVRTIAALMILGPIGVMALCMIAAWRFHLTADTHAVLVHEVERLRKGETNAETDANRKVVEDLTGWKFSTLWGRGRLP